MSKILPTIGPQTEKFEDLKKVMKFSDFLRLNGSYKNLNWHRKISKRIKFINPKTKILFDLPGIKPRTRNNKDIKVDLGQIVVFHYKKFKKNNTLLKIKISNPFPDIKKNVKFLILKNTLHPLSARLFSLKSF